MRRIGRSETAKLPGLCCSMPTSREGFSISLNARWMRFKSSGTLKHLADRVLELHHPVQMSRTIIRASLSIRRAWQKDPLELESPQLPESRFQRYVRKPNHHRRQCQLGLASPIGPDRTLQFLPSRCLRHRRLSEPPGVILVKVSRLTPRARWTYKMASDRGWRAQEPLSRRRKSRWWKETTPILETSCRIPSN